MKAPPLGLSHCEQFDVREGGMAHVYLCRGSAPYDDLIAVKKLKPQYAAMPDIARLFLSECYIWLRLGRHPNVVHAKSVHGVPPEPPMVVLEYVPDSLRDRLRGVPLDLPFVVTVIANICAGMAFIANRMPGFVHRDLKPENVLLDASGRAKVTDFGLATVKSRGIASDETPFVGTPMYMAPEQIQNEQLSAATDIYAVGCIFFEMLTGQPVFGSGKSMDEYLRCHADVHPVDVRKIRTDAPACIAAMVQSCLGKDPSTRHSTFEALREDLQRLIGPELGVDIPPVFEGEVLPHELYASSQGLMNLGLREDAMSVAEELIALEPEEELVLMTRILQARICGEEGEFEKARGFLDEIGQRIGPETHETISASYHIEAARMADSLGNLEDHVFHAELTTTLIPEASVGWHNLASAYIANDRIEDAIAAERRAIEIAPNLAYFIKLANILLHEKGEHVMALAVLEAAISQHSHLYQPYEEYVRVAFAHIMHLLKAESVVDMSELPRTMRATLRAARSARQLGAPGEVLDIVEESIAKIISTFTQGAK